MVDIAPGFGIDQRHAGLAVEMAGEIGEIVGEDFEDRRVDLDSANVFGAEQEPRQNVPTAAQPDDSDVGKRLHQIGSIVDAVLQVVAAPLRLHLSCVGSWLFALNQLGPWRANYR